MLNVESESHQPPAESGPPIEARKLSISLFRKYKTLIDRKFPLVETTALGQLEFINEALTDGDSINFLYLPKDKSRRDPEKQIKVSSSRERLTVIIKNDNTNPEISFQTFDNPNDSQPPRMTSYVKNTPEAVEKAQEMLARLRDLRDFDLVYPREPHRQ